MEAGPATEAASPSHPTGHRLLGYCSWGGHRPSGRRLAAVGTAVGDTAATGLDPLPAVAAAAVESAVDKAVGAPVSARGTATAQVAAAAVAAVARQAVAVPVAAGVGAARGSAARVRGGGRPAPVAGSVGAAATGAP